MIGAFETSLTPTFHRRFKDTESGAIQEAAITNALVHRVDAVRVKPNDVAIIGHIHKDLLLSRLPGHFNEDVTHMKVKITNSGSFHTTWDKILRPSSPLGYLTFYPPIEVITEFEDSVDHDFFTLSIVFERLGLSLPLTTFGLWPCDICGKEIPESRLRAAPDTLYCVECMKKLEEKEKNHAVK